MQKDYAHDSKQLKELGISEEEYHRIIKKIISNPNAINKEEFVIIKRSLIKGDMNLFTHVINSNNHLAKLDKEYEAEKAAENPKISDLASLMSKLFANDSGVRVVGGKEALFYGISTEDHALWSEYIDKRDDQSIHAIISAKRYHLLTHVIGNPNDEFNKFLVKNEAAYGNTMLHDRVVNSCDKSIITPTEKGALQALIISRKATDYLLRFYELHLQNAEKNERENKNELARIQRERVSLALQKLDIQGKTPLLLSCKSVNDNFSQRLVLLDIGKQTINVSDVIEQRTPLHIACIMGLINTATALIKAGADVNACDKYGKKPYEYLSCPEQVAEENIVNILESIHFFQGVFFGDHDKKQVVTTIIQSREKLAKTVFDSSELAGDIGESPHSTSINIK
jgi:hypothetical protein